jgi:hypothetical protein
MKHHWKLTKCKPDSVFIKNKHTEQAAFRSCQILSDLVMSTIGQASNLSLKVTGHLFSKNECPVDSCDACPFNRLTRFALIALIGLKKSLTCVR